MKRAARITGLIIGWLLVTGVGLLLLTYLLIQIPGIQNFAKDKAVVYLHKKLGTEVAVGRLSLDFPKKIVLENVLIRDKQDEILLSGKRLAVTISIFKLLKNDVEINYLELNGITANIYRLSPDSTFNFQFIVDAFAGDGPKDTTASAPMYVRLDKLDLVNVNGRFQDDYSGNHVRFALKNLTTSIERFNTAELHYSVPTIFIDGLNASVHQYKPLVSVEQPMAAVQAKSDQPADLDLKLQTVDLNNIIVAYNNDVSAVETNFSIGALLASIKTMSLPNRLVELEEISLKNSRNKIVLGRSTESQKVASQAQKEVAAQVDNPWRIKVDKIDFADNNLSFDNHNMPTQKSGFDYAHFNIVNLIVDGDNVRFSPSEMSGNINNIAFTEQRSNFSLQKLHTDFVYNDKEISLNNLLLQTDKTVLRDHISLTFDSLAVLSKRPGDAVVDATINQSEIAFSDLLAFVPSLAGNTPFKQNKNGKIYLNTQIKGSVKDLSIPYIQLRGLSGTTLDGMVTIKGLPNAQTAVYNATIHKLKTNRKDLQDLLPPSALPASIQLPSQFTLSGKFNGSVKAYSTNLNLATDRGSLHAIATVTNTGKNYNAKVNVADLDVGFITKNSATVGKLSSFITVTGSGFDPKTANAFAHADVRTFGYNGYTYNNVSLDAELKNGLADVKAESNDRNAAFNLTALVNLKKKKPAVDLELKVDNIDLQALHFSKDPLKIKGRIIADVPVADIDSLNGNIQIRNLYVTHLGKLYVSDSINIAAVSNPQENSLQITSDFLTANLKGRYRLTEIASALQSTINNYYHIPGYKPSPFQPQDWKLDMNLYVSPVVLQFLPELKGTKSVFLNADFNSSTNDLNVDVKSPVVIYGKQSADSLNLRIYTDDQKLNYALSTQAINAGGMKFYGSNVSGYVANNKIYTDAVVKDAKGAAQYHLSAEAASLQDSIVLKLNPQTLLLDYEKWDVSGDNFIVYFKKGLLVNNLVLSQGTQQLAVNSTPAKLNAPLHILFKDFDIKTIAQFANQDTLLASGLINGTAVVKNLDSKPAFTADLAIQNLLLKQDTVGNVQLKVDNEAGDLMNANIRITGKNQLSVTGTYNVATEVADLALDMQKLDLSILKSLGGTNVSDAGGIMYGELNVNGKLSAPEIDGNFKFRDAFIAPSILGERFSLPSDGFAVTPAGIEFNNFTLKDSLGNKAIVDGYVFTSDFTEYAFDISLSAENFRAVNARKQPNQMFYGKLTLDADAYVTGEMDNLVVDGSVMIDKETDFSFILPGNNPELLAREGVVNFVKIDSLARDTVQLAMNEDSVSRYADLKGLDVYLDIETDTAAQLALVIDERNGDILRMRGKADLALGIDKSGKLSLTGTYLLNSGSYDISLNLLSRHFDIDPGSQITWTGDPTAGLINLNATYIANAPSLDLVEPQLVGRSPAEVNRFKQRLPFHVKLSLSGELLKPTILFDIDLPEKQAAQWNEVEQKLTEIRRDQAELNKQVFALLLLNRFVGENPFTSTSGGDNSALESFARQSVSRLLSEQLNRIASDLIQGVDINVGVQSYEDYSTGQHQNRSDLTVQVSKRLLNDRLKVNVGSAFQVEGESNKNQQRNNLLGDVSLDYQLSSDGRYVLRAYRNNTYEAVVEGQIIETGLSFIFTLDFDQFKDILKKKSEADLQRRRKNKK